MEIAVWAVVWAITSDNGFSLFAFNIPLIKQKYPQFVVVASFGEHRKKWIAHSNRKGDDKNLYNWMGCWKKADVIKVAKAKRKKELVSAGMLRLAIQNYRIRTSRFYLLFIFILSFYFARVKIFSFSKVIYFYKKTISQNCWASASRYIRRFNFIFSLFRKMKLP